MTDVDDHVRLLVKVSTMYYLDGLNQQEISLRLGISRPQISRMLTAARTRGLVQIRIQNPFQSEQVLERAVMETFSLRDVTVIDLPGGSRSQVEREMARSAAAIFESVLRDGDVVGVMAGRGVAALVGEVGQADFPRVRCVPLVGGWGAEDGDTHASTTARRLAQRLRAQAWTLSAPAVVATSGARSLLMGEAQIGPVLDLARRADVNLVGFGPVRGETGLLQDGHLPSAELEAAVLAGAVASVGGSLLDIQGALVHFEASARLIGLELPEIRQARSVIGLGSGPEKVEALLATLRGRWIDVLVTDRATAQAVLEWQLG